MDFFVHKLNLYLIEQRIKILLEILSDELLVFQDFEPKRGQKNHFSSPIVIRNISSSSKDRFDDL